MVKEPRIRWPNDTQWQAILLMSVPGLMAPSHPLVVFGIAFAFWFIGATIIRSVDRTVS